MAGSTVPVFGKHISKNFQETCVGAGSTGPMALTAQQAGWSWHAGIRMILFLGLPPSYASPVSIASYLSGQRLWRLMLPHTRVKNSTQLYLSPGPCHCLT